MSGTTRRTFLAGTVAGTGAMAQRAQTRRPNVLFLMSDDMRVELGCYQSRFHAQTPNLDALAHSGVRFDRNYCQFPLCNPSRSSLMTGRHPMITGVLGNRTAFRDAHPDWISLPQLFKDNGYVSARTGKIFHGGIDDPKAWTVAGGATDEEGAGGGGRAQATMTRAQYSDRIVVLEGNGEEHGDYHTADRAISYLRQYKDRPFFIGCGFVKPHSPPTAPRRFFDLYDVSKLQLPPDFAAMPTVPAGFPKAAIRPKNADLFIGRPASEDEARAVIRAYLASISWCDWNIGRVIGELDRLGLRENTIIVFVVDHGYQLGEKGKWSKAGSLFEMGTRVPMIISAPGQKGNGQASLRMVQSIDIYSTLVELCGLKLPPGNQGRSLASLLARPDAGWEYPAYSVWSEDGESLHGVAVRTEQWRYAEFGPKGVNGAMLFDPHADPFEMKNLAEEPRYAKIRAELSALVRTYAAMT
jgi:arylsulfatase A-like enzyme